MTIKYLIPKQLGEEWLATAEMFTTPEEAALAWQKRTSNFAHSWPVRLLVDGELSVGTYEQIQPLFSAVNELKIKSKL